MPVQQQKSVPIPVPAIIIVNMESTEPQNTVLRILRELDGKLLRKDITATIEHKLNHVNPGGIWHCYISKSELSGTDLSIRLLDKHCRTIKDGIDIQLKISRESTHNVHPNRR